MEAVNIHTGSLVFDRADYDAEGDVLYLHVGEPTDGETRSAGHGPTGFPRDASNH
jgi:hypothetical protein